MSKPPPRVKFGLQALDNLNEPVAPCLTLHLPFLITDVARGSLVCNWLMLRDVDCSSAGNRPKSPHWLVGLGSSLVLLDAGLRLSLNTTNPPPHHTHTL